MIFSCPSSLKFECLHDSLLEEEDRLSDVEEERKRERESAWSDEGHSCRGQIYRRARLPGETWPRCNSGSSGCNWDRTTSATSPPTEGEISPQATHLISHTGTYSVSLAMNQIFFKLKDFYFLVTFVLSISLIMSRERYFSIEGLGLHKDPTTPLTAHHCPLACCC